MRKQITVCSCDICGKTVSQHNHYVRLYNGKTAVNEHKNEEYEDYESVDLCTDCQAKLLNFIKTGEGIWKW